MRRKINIVPESVYNNLKMHGISKAKLEASLSDFLASKGDNEDGKRVSGLIAVVQFLWNENVVLKERLQALMPEKPKKTIKKKSIHKGKFQCVKCGEWFPHSKVEVWDENPSVIRYICSQCMSEEDE